MEEFLGEEKCGNWIGIDSFNSKPKPTLEGVDILEMFSKSVLQNLFEFIGGINIAFHQRDLTIGSWLDRPENAQPCTMGSWQKLGVAFTQLPSDLNTFREAIKLLVDSAPASADSKIGYKVMTNIFNFVLARERAVIFELRGEGIQSSETKKNSFLYAFKANMAIIKDKFPQCEEEGKEKFGGELGSLGLLRISSSITEGGVQKPFIEFKEVYSKTYTIKSGEQLEIPELRVGRKHNLEVSCEVAQGDSWYSTVLDIRLKRKGSEDDLCKPAGKPKCTNTFAGDNSEEETFSLVLDNGHSMMTDKEVKCIFKAKPKSQSY